jgi:hypothetical protein
MAQDTMIPVPVTSGATDNPDAPQSGAVAPPPPLPSGYQRAGQAATPPPLPSGYQRAGSASQAPVTHQAVKPVVRTTTKAAPVQPEPDILTAMEEPGALAPAQSLVAKGAKGVRGLYHGVMGDEETPQSKGQTTTASPAAENLGFTPEHVGYELGSAARGIGKFVKEGVQDIAGNTPIAIPNKGDTASFDDPKAHTLVAKYITAPSMAEREASEKEMEEYYKSQGPAAAGHAISAFLHGTLGEYVPAIGPLAMAIESQAQKGDLGGALAQVATLYAFDKGTGAVKEGIKDRVNAKVEELTKTPEIKQAEENVQTLEKERKAAEAKHQAALAEHNKYQASHAQGINSPEKIVNEVNKAKKALDEAEAHHELAKEDLDNKKAAQPTLLQQAAGAAGRAAGKVLPSRTPAPEVPAENIETAPAEQPVLAQLGATGTAKPALPPINVKTPGQVQPETFPQEPKPTPRPSYGRIALAEDRGTMGTPKQLTEGTPIGPQMPKGGLPKINLPEPKPVEAPKPATDEAALRALSAKKGEVVETPEKKVGRLLQEALKTEKEPKQGLPAAKAEESPVEHRAGERRVAEEAHEGEERRQTERRVLKQMNENLLSGKGEARIDTDAYAKAMEQARKELGPDASVQEVIKRRDEIVSPEAKGAGVDVGERARQANPEPTRAETKAKPSLPNEEPTGYAAKKEEVVPAGAEGREPLKSAAEYSPAVEQKVGELSDENLRRLAKSHGLNPDEYDFKARDERRHRVERDQLVKEVTSQMGEDEKINLGRAAESAEKEGTFQGADVSAKGRADRAEKMFPRLRGPVDENGNPKASGGAPDAVDNAMEEINKKFTTNPENAGAGTEPKELAVLGSSGKPEATFTVKSRGGNLRISGINSLKQGIGSGTRTLKALTDIADKHGVTIELTASPYGDEKMRLNKDQLAEWYERHGFLPEEGHDPAYGYMVRQPKTPALADVEAERLKEHVASTSAKDTDHVQAAMKELGSDAKLSDIMRRAQEMKEQGVATTEQLAAHDKNGGSTFSSKGKDLNGTDNYSVGSYPDRTEQVDKLTPERLEEFKKKNSDLLSKEGHAVGTWKDPDTGKAVLDVSRTYADRDKAIAAGKAANQKAIYHLGGEGEIKTGGTGLVNSKGSPVDEFGNPTVSGGAPEKNLPTGDQLIKKYGESSGDPKDLTFILKDGRGVKNTGSIHDEMLGGKATDKNPPRERFVDEGNIRVRPHQGTAGREVSLSIPESGITLEQLKYIQKMSAQLQSGAVNIEVGKPGGAYKIVPYGEATPEVLEKRLRELGPVLNDKGSPIDENGNPTVSGGSQAGAAAAKAAKLPKVAEEHLTEEERAGVTKTEAGSKKFVDNLKSLPSVQEFTDIAKAGEGGRKWYQRSAAAFDALTEEAPKYFKEGDRQKFTDFLAALSPQQSVKMNLGEALNAWTRYVDEGRPSGKELEKLLKDELTLSGTKIPNATKALAGEPLWPDLSKNEYFKVPSFAKNLNGYLNYVTNDGWQALFGGLDAKKISKANSYHPLAVVTRAAADALGWEPAEAQAAIWAFTKTFTEKGEILPEDVRRRSEDFADILALDPEIRQQLAQLGVNHEQLDAKLRAIGKKPPITSGASSTTEGSVRKLANRIETARGKGTIPQPKSGNLNFDEDEETRFNPADFANEESGLAKLGEKKKKSPYGKLR